MRGFGQGHTSRPGTARYGQTVSGTPTTGRPGAALATPVCCRTRRDGPAVDALRRSLRAASRRP